jgi:hypothetical protein
MPTYTIEQYEIHVATWRVKATSAAHAIAHLINPLRATSEDVPELVDNSIEYVDIADTCGMPSDEHPELAEALEARGINCAGIIPSIRSVEEN